MQKKMMKLVSSMFLIFSYSVVASEWVELPKMTPFKDIITHSSGEVTIPSLQTSVSKISVEFDERKTTLSLMKLGQVNETEQSEVTENEIGHPLNLTLADAEDYYDEESFSVWDNKTSFIRNNQLNDTEDSLIIEETINETKKFIAEPEESITEKMKYLNKIQNKLLAQTRIYAEGIWPHPSRQARDKKLLGFPSMEGALMTIAFLTFAVFLIKIVMQFIQGLQNAEQTLLMTLSSTAAPVRISNRPKRAAQNAAAANILRYIDEYSSTLNAQLR